VRVALGSVTGIRTSCGTPAPPRRWPRTRRCTSFPTTGTWSNVTLLDLLVRYEPDAVMGTGWKAVLHLISSYQSRYLAGGGELFWSVGRRSWTLDQIEDTRPRLTPALTGLLATLRSHGLAQEQDSAPETAKQLAEDLAKQINRQAGQNQRRKTSQPPTLQVPTFRNVQERWAPTERGEQVLGYYELAAEQGEPASSE